jgi:hypothetical protein
MTPSLRRRPNRLLTAANVARRTHVDVASPWICTRVAPALARPHASRNCRQWPRPGTIRDSPVSVSVRPRSRPRDDRHRWNLGSILAARTATAFHLGTLSLTASDDRLLGNSLLTLVLAASVFPLVGAGSWLLTWAIGQPTLDLRTVVLVATLSGLVLALLSISVTFVATYLAYRLQLDPDDIVIPVVTNVGDVLGVLVLFAVTHLLLLV